MNLSAETIAAAEALVKHHNSNATCDHPHRYTSFYKDGALILVFAGEQAREMHAKLVTQDLLEELKQVGVAGFYHDAAQKIADEGQD